MIQIENLTFHYRDSIEAALRSLNLSVQKSETLAIMGANGSGKSTFAKILSKLLKPDRGVLKIGSDNSASVGIVFQNPDNQMIALTVEKELAFGLENFACPLDIMQKKVNEILERFEITHLRHRIISELSGGEKQRVAVASVMITEPEILLLDEPDSFLDYQGKQLLLEQLKIIQENHPDIIIMHITQYKNIATLYPRMLLFSEGEIIADASPSEIVENKNLMIHAGLSYIGRINNIENFLSTDTKKNKVLQVENLSFKYNDSKELLRNITLSLSQGEVVGLAGNSGSGKSTLASLLCGLIPMQFGNISVTESDEKDDLSSFVTMLFQQPESQFFLQTVNDEILFGINNQNLTFSKDKMKELLSLVGLDYKRIIFRDPQTLSGGEKRRLAFAVVLALAYDFILFDEPTCGLDLQGVSMFEELVENLKHMNKGVVVISHDFEILHQIADRIIYLNANGSATLFSKREFFECQRYKQIVADSQPDNFFS